MNLTNNKNEKLHREEIVLISTMREENAEKNVKMVKKGENGRKKVRQINEIKSGDKNEHSKNELKNRR